jgi:hypothetical protein
MPYKDTGGNILRRAARKEVDGEKMVSRLGIL